MQFDHSLNLKGSKKNAHAYICFIFVSSMIYDHLLHHVSRDIFHSRDFLAKNKAKWRKLRFKVCFEIEGFFGEIYAQIFLQPSRDRSSGISNYSIPPKVRLYKKSPNKKLSLFLKRFYIAQQQQRQRRSNEPKKEKTSLEDIKR